MNDIFLIGGAETEILSPEEAGGKAANLARMAALGLSVPPAFVIPTSLCAAFSDGCTIASARLDKALAAGIAFLEKRSGRVFGDRRKPLLVSVRSGAARSMPGMLETVLNVGCTADATRGLMRLTGNPRFAWDCRRRFLQAYLETVVGVDAQPLEANLEVLTSAEGAAHDRMLDGVAMEYFAAQCIEYASVHDAEVPDIAFDQLAAAARAVIGSWNSDKAKTYRKLQHFEDLTGTAVTVQSMVYGNYDLNSGSGVAFSRDPSSGDNRQLVDVLFDAQGEDVVSGRRTPESGEAMQWRWPLLADDLKKSLATLEREFSDVQDVEFTVESGKLWLLQTRAAKRTPRAALRIAMDHVAEGLISPQAALIRLQDVDLNSVAIMRFATMPVSAGAGIPAAPGVVSGRAAFDSEAAQRMNHSGDPVVLVRPDTSTADVAGFAAASGILTTTGGRTAHAALVARQMGKPCIVGCAQLKIDVVGRHAELAKSSFNEGDWISIDGNEGRIFLERLDIVHEAPDAELAVLATWKKAAELKN